MFRTHSEITREDFPDDMPKWLQICEAHHGFALAIVLVPLLVLLAAWVAR